MQEVRDKFPIKTTPNRIGELTYKAINELRGALYANAANIPTMLRGRGRNGHIDLTL